MSAFEKIKSLCGGDRADNGNSKSNSKISLKKKLKVKKLKLAKKRRIKLKKLSEKMQNIIQQERERENILNAINTNNGKMINLFDKSIKKARKKAKKIAKQNLNEENDWFKRQRRLLANGIEGDKLIDPI